MVGVSVTVGVFVTVGDGEGVAVAVVVAVSVALGVVVEVTDGAVVAVAVSTAVGAGAFTAEQPEIINAARNIKSENLMCIPYLSRFRGAIINGFSSTQTIKNFAAAANVLPSYVPGQRPDPVKIKFL
jgi:hypothetical protein